MKETPMYALVPIGKNPPDEVNVIIENPMGGDPVKYEVDKQTGVMFVDRFLHTAMYYPGNYGYIPQTLSGDGDPVDVLVVGQIPVIPGAVLPARPVGVLYMEDNAGMDEKIIAVPMPKMHPYHSEIFEYTQLPPIQLEQIKHFFTHYKDLEPGKWVKTGVWGGADDAKRLIREGIERAKAQKA
jgi:inorganic pyrophosphatase